MPLYQSQAFVLRTYKLGERDQIVVFFTRDYGKLRAVARRSQSARRPSASYYQPLTLLQAILFGRPSQTLWRINGVDIVRAYRELREDFELLRCGLYLTELVDAVSHEHDPMAELFDRFHAALEQLRQSVCPALVLRHFELGALMIAGYTPQLTDCARCARLLEQHERTFCVPQGGLVCSACAAEVQHRRIVSPVVLTALRAAIAGDSAPWSAVLLDDAAQREMETLLQAHLSSCLGRELKSYAFLHL